MKNLSPYTLAIPLGIVLAVAMIQLSRPTKTRPHAESPTLENTIEPIRDECQGRTRVYDLPIKSDQLIGLVYPPRLGPLHTNIEIKSDSAPCTSPFAEIYENKVIFRCQPNV